MPGKKKDLIDLSSTLPDIWRMLTDGERDQLRGNARVIHFKKNELIYLEDETPRDLMCLFNGKVKIFKSGVGGRSQIIRIIRPVQYFGYRAYFAREPYVTAASAFESCTVCMIPMELIEQFLRNNGDLALFFIQMLSVDLGIADQRVVNLTQKHVRGRLAESLIFLKESYGLEEDGATINIYLAREDLANLSNMTTSNAIRTLSNFVNERVITIDGRKIKIIDEDRLRKISRIG
ncbi:MAG: Crp/Fnr family transcriptional regulator [Bacteroidetes bacterium GWD2_45_23]|jgi:CRP-like cAMP-binding protein|nr:MAG: Crp/Fnr family transcriptional regulator [Bacteroidetes bacterium GWC2_46_850]OFX72885.1 MAG: Crp/Fnr family transcriptional regulator [Bacteroidetes bacterium GWC1_47_7]OFX84571.1 MAG: Crp/Fnr family transcriptional regulator [Bacteroidetes bacterium GWD2_45_23]HAR37089.1 Crp/Fnr family transcriptional regulator [Porphyromonadaceae bacterium]HBB00205.1 Crp/Fnr family transcriptional regulator [Porphyromonadaceae bacterium]